MPATFCVRTRDNRWISQKLSMEKSTIGNEPYIEKATVLGSFFVLREILVSPPLILGLRHLTDKRKVEIVAYVMNKNELIR